MQVGRIGSAILHNLQRSINPSLRFMSKESVSALNYKEYGEPADVLQLTKDTIDTTCLDQNEVIIKDFFIISTINIKLFYICI